ncbi:hypothetical protein [Marinobacterium litorale]|uniref:hypothetical protein n=1 Tax=Marinobacterium litorale TaxID=404770 RepID=UPI0003F93029|nr:hypothetical protein [Marinobacterium litorale]
MMIKNKLALAVMVAGISTQVSAVELGEFNGTTFSVGGYIKGEAIIDRPDDVAKTAYGDDDSFDSTARQSRVNFKASKSVEGHKLTGFVEGDFYGSGSTSYDWRLRHAYMQVDNLTVGQTWNGQFWTNAPFDVEILDFFGTGVGSFAGSGAVVRPDLVVHYTTGGFRFTAQDPLYADADIPDLVAAYTYRAKSGHAVNIAVSGREVETDPAASDSEFGVSLQLSGKFKFGNTSVAAGAFSGEGGAVYAGWGDDVDASNDLTTTTGFYAGISQKFSPKLRGNLRYGQVESDEIVREGEDTVRMTNVNLIYTYVPGLDFGIEWRDRSATTIPTGLRTAGQQIEVMAMYKF